MRKTTERRAATGLEHVSDKRPVLVIGGGIAGTTAAWALSKRGVPVRLIEATPHVGGRIHTVAEHGGLVETGMQFYYGGYRETNRLLDEVGLRGELVPIHLLGEMYWGGQAHRFSKTRPWLGALGMIQNLKLQLAVARRVGALLRISPYDYRADEPHDVDVAEYFLRHGDEEILELAIRPMTNSYAFCEPEGHSLAMLLRILKMGATSKIYGLKCGNSSLPAAMASELDVVTGRATSIQIERGCVTGITLERDGGGEERVETSCVICAVRAPQAAEMLGAAPSLADQLGRLTYSSVVLANLHLDGALHGDGWVWVHSRKAGHKAAFAVDLRRRAPEMFPDGRSVVQVNFASPMSDDLLGLPDDNIVELAIKDMEAFLPQVRGQVRHTSVVRRPRVIPSFDVGTFGAVRALQEEAGAIEGLHLAGDYLRAPLCEGAVRSARQVVDELLLDKRRLTAPTHGTVAADAAAA